MTRRARLMLGLLAALVATFFPPFSAARDLWLVEPTAVLRIDTDRGDVQSSALQGSVRAIAPVAAGGAWLLMDDALVLLDAALVERARVALPLQGGRDVALAAQPDDGSAWLGIDTRLLHVTQAGAIVADWTLDAPAHAVAVAGPDAVMVASTLALTRHSRDGTVLARVDLAGFPGSGAPALLLDPLGGYAWVARAGALLQFDVLANLAPRLVLPAALPDAMAIAHGSGELSVVSGRAVARYDRDGRAMGQGTFTAESLNDLAGVVRNGPDPALWFGDRAGFGVLDLITGRILRVPESVRTLLLAAAPLHLAPSLSLAEPTRPQDPAGVTLWLQVLCNDLPCVATRAYRERLALRAEVDGRDVTSSVVGNAARERFSLPVPWPSASLHAQAVDAYGNRSAPLRLTVQAEGQWAPAASAKAAPTVTISAPASNASYVAPAAFTVKVAATAGTGATISKVELLAAGVLIGTVAVAPYNFAVSGLQVGTYSYTARVTDSLGASATSAAVTVKVTAGTRATPSDAWLFNDGWASAGVVTDSAGTHNGVPSGSITAVTASASAPRPNTCKAASFAGGAVDVTGLGVSTAAGAVTSVSFWMYWNGTDGAAPIGWPTFGLRFAGGAFGFGSPAGDVFGVPSTGMANRWTHVVAQFVNGNVAGSKLYLNGVLQTLGQRVGTPDNARAVVAAALAIGGSSGASTGRFGGQLDEVRVYRRALSASEASAEFAAANPCAIPPTVALTTPVAGASFIAPAAIGLAATATPATGGAAITKVEFYSGTTLVATATTAPYAYAWNNVGVGNYALKAKATDASGATAFSPIASAAVKANTAPKVSLAAPASGAAYTAPAAITITASASDADGSIASVDVYQGSTRLASLTSAPYTYTWVNVPGGSYSLTAKAKDDRGAVTTSAAVAVKVNKPPTASITAPANNALIVLPATVTVSAAASDADGTVAKVEFFRDGALVGADTTAPYSMAWANPLPGTYVLTARSTDNLGAATTSTPVTVTVKTNVAPLVTLTAPSSGTTVVAGAPVSFAATASDADGSIVNVQFYADQGTTAQYVGLDSAAPYGVVTTFAPGHYVVSAIATDNKGAVTWSSPVTLDVVANQAPQVTLASPDGEQLLIAPTTLPDLALAATATDVDGRVAAVRFYKQGYDDAEPVLLGSFTAPPYAMTWKSIPYGAYGVWAEAVDELGAVSEPASQTVTVAPTMPASQALLKIVSPNLGVTRPPLRFVAPATLVVTVDASVFARMELIGDGGTVDAVVGANGPGNTFVLTWRAVGAGTHTVAVRGTDGLGRSRETDPFAMMVAAPDAPRPSISMATPVNGLVMDNGGDLAIAVDVSNPAGGTPQVAYLEDFQWLGFTASAPHTFTARSLAYGLHRIEAQALDPTYGLVARTVAYVDATASGVPVGVMTKPLQNAVYTANETVTLAVNAVALTQPIAKVDFYEGPIVIATVTAPPYSVDRRFVAGSHAVRAYIESVRRTGAFTAPVQFTVGTAGVSISIAAPQEGQRFAAPAAIPLSATVSDPTSSVSQVTFYQLGTPIAVVQKPPYTATWADVPAGAYTINAVAQLKAGGLVSAAPVTVTVTRNTPPQVALTAPSANQTFAVGQPVSMNATATDADGTIAKVDFLAGATVVGTATAAPYGITWTPGAPGTYVLTAKASDNSGATVTSSPVSVAVTANTVPTVALVLPRNGQRLVPGAIDLLATASDADGSVARVDFYAGTTLVGSAAARPYAVTWTNASAGTFALTAVAVDNAGAVTRSDAATITVAPVALSIASPVDGASIPRDFVLVRGAFDAPDNAGVTVNGIVAASDGTNFFVNSVPLDDGPNTIEVTVTTETGATTSTSITVNRTATGVFRVQATADELLGPGSVTLNALWSTEVRPAMLMIENFGTASVDDTIFDGNRLVQLTFPAPGLYLPKVTVTDTDGKIYSQEIAILVQDKTKVDSLLRMIWGAASARLGAQDVEGAMKTATPGARKRYEAPLRAIASALPAAVASWQPPSGGDISLRVAEYSIRRIVNGVKNRYFIYMIKDGDGVWRLESM